MIDTERAAPKPILPAFTQFNRTNHMEIMNRGQGLVACKNRFQGSKEH
jgi:hypothetical protein